jgi:MerR family transcriptional regulator, copper efflux regulator
MRIQELTERTGETARTVRFLIAEGVMPPPSGGRALAEYSDAHLAAIRRYQRLRAAGYKISAIRLLIERDEAVSLAIAPGISLQLDPTVTGSALDAEAIGRLVTAALTDFLKETPDAELRHAARD